MQRILMVCLGNICRSPLAEGILKSKVNSEKIFIDSAGTGAYHIGHLPDERAIKVAKKYNIDITNQKARQITVDDFEEFDIIFAMDESNLNNILSLARNEDDKNKAKLILKESNSNKNLSVPDPYFGGDEGFEDVYQMLDEVCEVIASKLY